MAALDISQHTLETMTQLLDAMGEELGDVDDIVNGNWQPMLDWLRAKIHQEGSKFTPSELIHNAIGNHQLLSHSLIM